MRTWQERRDSNMKLRALIEALRAKAKEMFSEPIKFYYRQMKLPEGEDLRYRAVIALSLGGPAEEFHVEPFRQVVREHSQIMQPGASIPLLENFTDPSIELLEAKWPDEENYLGGKLHGIKFTIYSRTPLGVLKELENEHFVPSDRIE